VNDAVWYKLNAVFVSHVKQSDPELPLQVKQVLSHGLHVVPTAYSFESHEAVQVKYDEWKYNETAQV